MVQACSSCQCVLQLQTLLEWAADGSTSTAFDSATSTQLLSHLSSRPGVLFLLLLTTPHKDVLRSFNSTYPYLARLHDPKHHPHSTVMRSRWLQYVQHRLPKQLQANQLLLHPRCLMMPLHGAGYISHKSVRNSSLMCRWGPALLKLDPALAALRFDLVPRLIPEELFWDRCFKEIFKTLQAEFSPDFQVCSKCLLLLVLHVNPSNTCVLIVCAVQTGLINGLERGLEDAYEEDPCSPCVSDMNKTTAQ